MIKHISEYKIISEYLIQHKADFAYIFGSFAQGQVTPESDVDIAVMFQKNSSHSIWQLRIELVQQLGREVDLIDLSKANDVIKNQIITTGKLIVGDEKQVKLNFEYPAITNYHQYLDDVIPVKESIKKRGFVWKK